MKFIYFIIFLIIIILNKRHKHDIKWKIPEYSISYPIIKF